MKNSTHEVINKNHDNRHLIVGYIFLGLVFLGAVSSVYFWENKAQSRIATPNVNRHVGSGEQVPTVSGATCELRTTYARQKQTGEIREFPSPCHVVDTWEIIR